MFVAQSHIAIDDVCTNINFYFSAEITVRDINRVATSLWWQGNEKSQVYEWCFCDGHKIVGGVLWSPGHCPLWIHPPRLNCELRHVRWYPSIRRKRLEKKHLDFPSWQCSSTQVPFNQAVFSKEHPPYSPGLVPADFCYLFPQLKLVLQGCWWHYSKYDGRAEKDFREWFPTMLPTALQSLADVSNCTWYYFEGNVTNNLFGVCEIKWFWELFEATLYYPSILSIAVDMT